MRTPIRMPPRTYVGVRAVDRTLIMDLLRVRFASDRLVRTVVIGVAWLAIIVSTAAAAPPEGPLVGAYYYLRYDRDRWTREPVTHTTVLGWYSSDDRAVAGRHLDWAG